VHNKLVLNTVNIYAAHIFQKTGKTFDLNFSRITISDKEVYITR